MVSEKKKNKKSLRKRWAISGKALFIGGYTVFLLFPIYWAIVTSFKTRLQAYQIPPLWLFFKGTLSNYYSLFVMRGFSNFFLNSFIVATFTTLLVILCAFPAVYAINRFKFRHAENLAFWILSTYMFPPIAIVIPIYMLFLSYGLLNTYIGLILAHTTFNLPIAVWLLRTYMMEIPVEVEEAAQIDGCSTFRVMFKITMPIMKPGLIATSLLCFIFSWNEYLFASTLVSREKETLPVGIGSLWTDIGLEWGEIGVATFLTITPVLIITLLLQKHLIRGLSLGVIK